MGKARKNQSESSQASELRRKADSSFPGVSHGRHAGHGRRALVHETSGASNRTGDAERRTPASPAAAREASEKYGDLFDFAPVGYFLWDAEGRILEVNLAGAALLGLDRDAVVQKRFGQFVAIEDRTAFADFCKRVLTTDTKQTCEVKFLSDGQPVYALVEGIAADDRQGREESAAQRSSTLPNSTTRTSWRQPTRH